MFEGFNRNFVRRAINRSAENDVDRRRFLRAAGFTGAGVAAGLGVLGAGTALAGSGDASPATAPAQSGGISDAAVLNFALNLEYLEAEFYLYAATGRGLDDNLTTGTGTRGGVTGGRRVTFGDRRIRQYADEIAGDELAHVRFLRAALGNSAVARPEINLREAFTAAAQAAGVIRRGQTFDPFADQDSFLLGAYIFEDVGVTAYKGAAPLIANKTFLEAAAGILAVEAYHAGLVRNVLLARGLDRPANQISDARDSLDGPTELDQGILVRNRANIVPADENAIAFSRTPGQVLNIVYLNPAPVTRGGFFPRGVNGPVNTSDDND